MQRSNQRACTRIDRVCEQRREPGGVWRGRKQGDWARKRDRGSQPIRLSFPFSLSFIYIYISFLFSPLPVRGQSRSFFTFKNHDDAHFSDS